MSRRSFVIGRSPYADVVLAAPGVARRHAELVATGDGRYHLTDCGSEGGTWRQAGETGAWEPVRQAFVALDEPLRLGDRLAADGGAGRGGGGKGRWRHDGVAEAPEPVRGRVERDPETGEIVPKRV